MDKQLKTPMPPALAAIKAKVDQAAAAGNIQAVLNNATELEAAAKKAGHRAAELAGQHIAQQAASIIAKQIAVDFADCFSQHLPEGQVQRGQALVDQDKAELLG